MPNSPVQDPAAARLFACMQEYTVDFTAAADAAFGTDYLENGQLLALAALARRGEVPIAELADIALTDRRQFKAFVQQLEGDDTIEIVRPAHDRRVKVARLTLAGRRRLRAAEAQLAEFFVRSSPLALEIAELTERPWLDDAEIAAMSSDSAFDLAVQIAQTGIDLGRTARSILGDDVWSALHGRRLVALQAMRTMDPCRPAGVAEALHMSPAGVTYLVDSLERLGMLERTRDVDGDRRGVRIVLTEAGATAGSALSTAVVRNRHLLHARFSAVGSAALAA